MSSSPEDLPAVVLEGSWFASWQAPNTAIEHPDRWRIMPERQPSRDVDPADRPAYRARYGRVVFATPDPDTARGSEPEDVVLVRAVMALRDRTQPVITLAPDAAAEVEAMLSGTDTDLGGQRGVVFEAAVLGRCASSPWVSDEALAIVEGVHQDLHVERDRLAHLEAEQALLANHPDGTADPVRERRLAELVELVGEARQDVRHVEGEFRQVAEQIGHRVAEARAQVINPMDTTSRDSHARRRCGRRSRTPNVPPCSTTPASTPSPRPGWLPGKRSRTTWPRSGHWPTPTPTSPAWTAGSTGLPSGRPTPP